MTPEEALARDLEATLKKEAKARSPQPHVQIEGSGVHWSISIKQSGRACKVHTFLYSGSGRSEYLVEFHSSSLQAMGRTDSRAEAVAAIGSWVWDGDSLVELHQKFPFVDERRRALAPIQSTLNACFRNLGSPLEATLTTGMWEFPELWIYGSKASCQVLEEQKQATTHFNRNRTRLGTAKTSDLALLAEAIHQWLQKGALTSTLESQFPFFRAGDHATYFESGRGVEWHWKDLLERATTLPKERSYLDPVMKHRAWLDQVGPSSVARRFWTFTSHHVLVFSRCSHYPYSTGALPSITPLEENRFKVECGGQTFTGNSAEIVARLEELLSPHSSSVFEGTTQDLLETELRQALSLGSGSPVVSRIQEGQWDSLYALGKNQLAQFDRLDGDAGPLYVLTLLRPDETGKREHIAWFRTTSLKTLIEAARCWASEQCSIESFVLKYPSVEMIDLRLR